MTMLFSGTWCQIHMVNDHSTSNLPLLKNPRTGGGMEQKVFLSSLFLARFNKIKNNVMVFVGNELAVTFRLMI